MLQYVTSKLFICKLIWCRVFIHQIMRNYFDVGTSLFRGDSFRSIIDCYVMNNWFGPELY